MPPTSTMTMAMVSQIFTIANVLEMCYNSDFDLSDDESSCDREEEVHDKELFSLRRWLLSEELSFLSFLTRQLAQLALSRKVIPVLMRVIMGTLKVGNDM